MNPILQKKVERAVRLIQSVKNVGGNRLKLHIPAARIRSKTNLRTLPSIFSTLPGNWVSTSR